MNNHKQRRHFPPEQKLQIVLESLQRDTTIEAVSKKFGYLTMLNNSEKLCKEQLLKEKEVHKQVQIDRMMLL